MRSHSGPSSFMKWTEPEDEVIRQVFHSIAGRLCYLCKRLGRSPAAIYMRAIRLGIWR